MIDNATQAILNDRISAGVPKEDYSPSPTSGGFLPEPRPVMNDQMGVEGAIRTKADRMYGDDMRVLGIQKQLQQPIRNMRTLNLTSQMAQTRLHALYVDQYNRRKRELDDETRRAQALGNIIGAAGMGVGAYLGGTGGALAGGAIGRGLGGGFNG